MLKIEIKKGEEKIDVPMGVFVNGFIINVPSSGNHQPMIQYTRVNKIQPLTPDHKGD